MELVETPSMKTHQDDQMVQSLKQPLMCPRCESANTKFCYYNNYTKSQPRHYCRSCKRYWTEGGTLRNVPLPTGGRAVKKRRIRTPSKSKNNKMGPTGGVATHVSFDEGLDQKMDTHTQLVVLQKDERFGGISYGCVQNDVLEILHNNTGCTDVVGCCSSDQSLFDHEMFSFQLPEVSELVQRNVDMDLRWEDDDHTFCVTDFLNMDVPEVIQPWS